SATRSFSVDTSAPNVTITSAPPDPTNLAMVTFNFTYSVTVVTAQCAYDGGAPVDCFGAGGGAFSTLAGAEGSHTFAITACASVSLCSNDTYTFTVDRTAPQITIDPIADPNNFSPLAITFSVTGNPAQVTCQLDTGAAVPCAGIFTTPSLAN